MIIPVDRNIKIYQNPRRKHHKPENNKYPWADMCVRDSFGVPCTNILEVRRTLDSVKSMIKYQGKRTGRTYIVRYNSEEVRVWRVS